MNGSALAVDWAKQHANAIVEAWYPGEEGGKAIADALTGKSNPAGRLPITFYASTKDLPSFDDYSMAGRTYRYYAGTPLWGFGYGLSYSSFPMDESKALLNFPQGRRRNACGCWMWRTRAIALVMQWVSCTSRLPRNQPSPRVALVGFDRLALTPHAKQHIHFMVDPRALSTVDAKGVRAVRAGDYVLHLGGTQATSATDGSVSAAFTIHGNEELPQ